MMKNLIKYAAALLVTGGLFFVSSAIAGSQSYNFAWSVGQPDRANYELSVPSTCSIFTSASAYAATGLVQVSGSNGGGSFSVSDGSPSSNTSTGPAGDYSITFYAAGDTSVAYAHCTASISW